MTRAEYNRQLYLRNREKRLAAQKEYYWANKEARTEYNKQYAVEKADAIKAQRKSYREANSEKRKEAMRDWYTRNADHAKNKAKEYRESNRSKMSEWSKNYRKEREKQDPLFKLSRRIRTLIYAKFRQGGYTKRSKTFLILGCSFEEFKTHLETRFSPGMAWENYGDWHIDHIIPVATATTEEELLKLNHYSNLYPLWASDNLKKGKKVPQWLV